MRSSTGKTIFDYYEQSVQDPEGEIPILFDICRAMNRSRPTILREDFCGSGWLSAEWVKLKKNHTAIGVDLCADTIQAAYERHWLPMPEKDRARLQFHIHDVLHAEKLHANLVVALNFSYWFFHDRATLLQYFRSVKKSLKPGGVFVLDVLGGAHTFELGIDSRRIGTLTYEWECQEYDPITHRCRFAIHFKDRGQKKIDNAFVYDWRQWTIPELRDILHEAGFGKTLAFWEGDDGKGGGNGEFKPAKNGENDAVWIAYIGATIAP